MPTGQNRSHPRSLSPPFRLNCRGGGPPAFSLSLRGKDRVADHRRSEQVRVGHAEGHRCDRVHSRRASVQRCPRRVEHQGRHYACPVVRLAAGHGPGVAQRQQARPVRGQRRGHATRIGPRPQGRAAACHAPAEAAGQVPDRRAPVPAGAADARQDPVLGPRPIDPGHQGRSRRRAARAVADGPVRVPGRRQRHGLGGSIGHGEDRPGRLDLRPVVPRSRRG